MQRTLLAMLLVAGLAGCVSPEGGQVPIATGQIDGAVVDNLLQPFSNQPVHLTELILRDNTSPLGGFTFRNVPIGSYTLLTSLDGYQSAFSTVTVLPDRITRVILQLIPFPDPEAYFISAAHAGSETLASPGSECLSCAWNLPLIGTPEEFIFEALWEDSAVGGNQLEFEVSDDFRHLLFLGLGKSDGEKPFTITIAAADLHPDAKKIMIRVKFSQEFTTQPRFLMQEVATFYYGETRQSMFFT